MNGWMALISGCREGSFAMRNILSGARAAEAAAD
jgi:hypothetical protein